MSLAAALREALERGHRERPELIAGDVLEGEELERRFQGACERTLRSAGIADGALFPLNAGDRRVEEGEPAGRFPQGQPLDAVEQARHVDTARPPPQVP